MHACSYRAHIHYSCVLRYAMHATEPDKEFDFTHNLSGDDIYIWKPSRFNSTISHHSSGDLVGKLHEVVSLQLP